MRSYMRITNIEAKNFKSFQNLSIGFDDFTLIVGANAAGKSNLMSIFKFLKDIMLEGLDNAIALQGGIEYLSNVNLDKNEPIDISFRLKFDQIWYRRASEDNKIVSPTEFSYRFKIMKNKRRKNYTICYDELKINFNTYKREKDEKTKKYKYIDSNSPAFCTITKDSAQSKYILSGCNIYTEIDLLLDALSNAKNEILLYRLSYFLPALFSEENLIKVYDFDPQKLKRPCTVSARKILESDGSNLAAVLQYVTKNPKQHSQLIQLLKNSLPFINKLMVEQKYDQSYSFKICERYSEKSFYANFLSDGTVSIIAIILALYFQEQSDIVIIEEPERNIHPKLLNSVVQMAKDVSQNKQIIFTTHNPEILSNVDLSAIRFVQRDCEGFSIVSKPSESKRVQRFISDELGVDELFLQNLLGDE